MKKKKRNPNCPACHGSGSYDTMETVEPCPFCNPQAAQQSMHWTAGTVRHFLYFLIPFIILLVGLVLASRQ